MRGGCWFFLPSERKINILTYRIRAPEFEFQLQLLIQLFLLMCALGGSGDGPSRGIPAEHRRSFGCRRELIAVSLWEANQISFKTAITHTHTCVCIACEPEREMKGMSPLVGASSCFTLHVTVRNTNKNSSKADSTDPLVISWQSPSDPLAIL